MNKLQCTEEFKASQLHSSQKHICKADENGLFFRLSPNKTLSLKGDSCNGGENSKGTITVLLACSVDGTN